MHICKWISACVSLDALVGVRVIGVRVIGVRVIEVRVIAVRVRV